MRFSVRKRRTAPAVIIVALIDVLVVLLIFLMVTTAFKQQPALKLTLPDSAQSQKSGAEELRPLMVNIVIEGTNSLYRYSEKNEVVTSDQLRSRLVADVNDWRQKNKDKEVRLAVRADKNAPWGKVVFVMDLARELNIKGLSALTKATKP
jgi:biopolymer transport protein ExbD